MGRTETSTTMSSGAIAQRVEGPPVAASWPFIFERRPPCCIGCYCAVLHGAKGGDFHLLARAELRSRSMPRTLRCFSENVREGLELESMAHQRPTPGSRALVVSAHRLCAANWMSLKVGVLNAPRAWRDLLALAALSCCANLCYI